MKLDCLQVDFILICCRALLSPESHLPDKHYRKRINDYDVPCATSISDDQVYSCWGLLKLEKWNVCHHSCADVTWPYRKQLLESKTAFCDICCKNCISPVDFVLHQECVHLCLPLFACPVCHFIYITHSCLQMHITESHGGPKTAISFLWLKFQKLYCYFIISWCSFYIVISLYF